MWFKHNRILLGKILLLLIVLLLAGLTIGCARMGTEPKGWSGGTIADGVLFLGVSKLVPSLGDGRGEQ